MSDTFDAPGSRNEAILQNMLGANNPLEPPQSRIEGLLQQLLEEGGGSGLPDVTAADNGKVLGVANGAWGAVENLPVIGYDTSTHICTFTAEQAEYMKSGKPFIVDGMMVMLPSVDGEPNYEAIVIASFRVMSGYFRFQTETTGYFWRTFDGSGTSKRPSDLQIMTAPEWIQDDAGREEGDTIVWDHGLGYPRWGKTQAVLINIDGSAADLFHQLITTAKSLATTSAPIDWYAPLDTGNFLDIVFDVSKSPVIMTIQPTTGQKYFLTFAGQTWDSSGEIESAQFHAEVSDETLSGDNPTAVATYPIDITYTRHAVCLHVEKREFTLIPLS